MRRIVILPVTNDDTEDLYVEGARPDTEGQPVTLWTTLVPVPPDNQLTEDVKEAAQTLDAEADRWGEASLEFDEGSEKFAFYSAAAQRRRNVAARLRAAFELEAFE